MNIINTRELLKNYIMSMLGEPVITVEISEFQLDSAIDLAIQKFTDFSMGGEAPKVFQLDLIPNVNQYILDDRIQAVTKVRTRSNSYNFQMPGVMVITPSEICAMSQNAMGGFDVANMTAVMGKISLLEKLYDLEPYYNFDFNTKILEFFDNTSTSSYNKVIIEAYVSYLPKHTDMIYNHQWIKDYSVALSKRIWGGNIGKYNTTLINGATLNYDRILTEAEKEIDLLNEQLLTRWTAPLGIYRG